MYVLFKTVHGSHLYGLNHAGSDEDFYTVVSKVKTNKARYAKQKIVDGIDTTTVDMGTWLRYCEAGVPQALEAMFSERPLIDHIPALRAQYTVGTQVFDRYLRTIKSFALNDENSYKQKRHALRLALNMQEMRGRGRFNPTLNVEQKSWTGLFANMGGNAVYRMALETAWKA